MMVTNLMLIYQKEINLSSLDKFIKAIYHLTNLILIYQKKINTIVQTRFIASPSKKKLKQIYYPVN
jgi:hypothetical protein